MQLQPLYITPIAAGMFLVFNDQPTCMPHTSKAETEILFIDYIFPDL